jgi:hypothetical protein
MPNVVVVVRGVNIVFQLAASFFCERNAKDSIHISQYNLDNHGMEEDLACHVAMSRLFLKPKTELEF